MIKHFAVPATIVALALTGALVIHSKTKEQVILSKEPEVIEPLVISINTIKQIAELATAETTLETVVPIQSQTLVLGRPIGTSSLTYRAIGIAKAGIDLSEISDQSFSVMGSSVVVDLPQAKILDIYLDLDNSEVYDSSRGFMGLGPDNLTDLLSEAQKTALEDMEKSVCPELIEEAQKKAETTIANFLYGVGFNSVTFVPNEGIPCESENSLDNLEV